MKPLASKQLKINPDLRRLITEITMKYPAYDQEKVLQKIRQSKSIRLPDNVIKTGVQAYFISHKIGNAEQKQPKEVVDIETVGKPKKRTKKNEFIIEFEDNENYRFSRLGGIGRVQRVIETEIFDLVNYGEELRKISRVQPNRGFLLSGSTGSGKTIIANCILSNLHNSSRKLATYSVSCYDLLGNDSEDKLRKVFQAAEEHVPSVIFLDNLQELCNKQNNKRMTSLPSLVLCNLMRNIAEKQVYVIGSTNDPDRADILTRPGMFYNLIEINNPDEAQRREIIEKVMEDYTHNLSQHVKELTLMTTGYVAVDVVNLFKKAAILCLQRYKRQGSLEEDKRIEAQDLKAAFKEIRPVLKSEGFAKIPTTKLQDVGALQSIKRGLIEQIIIPLRQQQKFTTLNFEVKSGGVLLYGPPGCGKTMIAKAIANEANASFILVKGPQLLNKYVGESESAVRKIFERARISAPCIIFFDQFDALAPKRQEQGNQVTERIVNTLLTELDGVEERRMVFVIAATNRPQFIDEAVLRSGRIERHLYVPLPDSRERLQILRKITRKISQQGDLRLQQIAEEADKFSGADLYFLIKKSILVAIEKNSERIAASDIKTALEVYKKGQFYKKGGNRFGVPEDEERDAYLLQYKQSKLKQDKNLVETEKLEDRQVKKKGKTDIVDEFLKYLMDRNGMSKNGF